MSAVKLYLIRLLPVLLCLVAACPGHAQWQPPRFVNLTRDQGLSDNTVLALAEDRRGFLWLATADGLNRYDGHDFKVYRRDPNDPSSISFNHVFTLLVDREGTLWAGTSNGLNRYRGETDAFERFLPDGGSTSVLSSTVYTLHQGASGDLWVGGYQGLSRFVPATSTFESFPVRDDDPESGPSGADILAVLEDREGDLWVGTHVKGLSRRDRKTGRFRHYRHRSGAVGSLAGDEVRALLEDQDGDLWVATHGGLSRYDRARDTFVVYRHLADDPTSLSSNHLNALFEDREGMLWVGTDDAGLDLFDRQSGEFLHLRHDPTDPASLGANIVRSVFEDRKGDLWIGTYTGGVSFYNRGTAAFHYYRHKPDDSRSLSHNRVASFFEEDDGTLWVGTEDGLNRFDVATGTFRSYRHDGKDPRSLSSPAVLAILIDSRRNFWLGTFRGGLNRFDEESGSFSHFLPDPRDPKSLSNPHVFGLFEDSSGRLWVGTFGGANVFDYETETFKRYPYDPNDPTSVGNDIVWRIYEDSRGTLWFTTPGGLSRYNEATDDFKTFRHRDDAQGLSTDSVFSILEDRSGRLWVGSDGGGLILFDRDSGTAEVFGVEDGLSNGIIYAILEADGLLWLATNDGISKFDPETRLFSNFSKSDGAWASPFSLNAGLKSRGGDLLFGGANGFNRFRPDRLQTDSLPPPVVFTSFQIFNEPAPFSGPGDALERYITEARKIVLRHDQSVISFDFAALNFRNPKRNRYTYKLEGFGSQDWVDAGGKHSATYTNLDAGTYTFRVHGSNGSGVWSEEGASIEIVVLPAYWETWWFRGLAFMALFATLAVAYLARTASIRSRNRALAREVAERRKVEAEREKLLAEMAEKNGLLEAQNEELERFTYTVSHDLKSPVVTIKGFAGLLKGAARSGNMDRLEESVDFILAAADNMHRLLSELLELSRVGRLIHPPEAIALSEIVHEAVALVDGKLRDRGVDVAIQEDMPLVEVDRLRVVEVYQNLIENAVKFMGDEPAPLIKIRAHRQGPEVVCHVRDNGIGIDPLYQDKVFGLFERLDATTEGTGIGLALVKRIVEVHGGRIWLESAGHGLGTTFFFTLPAIGDPVDV